MNASLIEIAIGAIVSADGTSGGNWSGGTSYGSGGAGSGGSILIEACSVSGAGAVLARGGASVGGSGAGSGGRVAIKAGAVSWSLGVSAAGGATSSGYTCGGAAGTVYVVNGTTSSLIFDNSDGRSDSSTCTLFPPELSGVQLSQLSILRKACVDVKESVKNNDVRAYLLDIDGSSKMTGDAIVIDTSTANLRGQITCTSALQLHNAQSGVGLVTAYTGSSMTCSSCTLKMSLAGSHVMLQGTVSASTLEIKGVERISLAGSLTVNGSELTIAAGSANIGGSVTCSGASCSIRVSVNTTLELGGTVRCTSGNCSLSLQSGGDMKCTGGISCSENNQCLVDVASG